MSTGWKINRSKPVSLDYTNPKFGYYKENPYWVRLDDVRSEAGLNHWLKHLSEKVWFDPIEFLEVRDLVLSVGL